MTVDALPAWPLERAGDALAAVVAAAGLAAPQRADLHGAPAADRDAWFEEAGAWLGVEVEAVDARHAELERALAGAAPALVVVPGGVLAIVRGGRRLVALDPDRRAHAIAVADVRDALERDLVAAAAAAAGSALAGFADVDRDAARRALVAAGLRDRRVGGIYLVRRAPDAPVRALVGDRRLAGRLGVLLAIQLVVQLAWLGSWWTIGHAVLGGLVSAGWVAAWALLLVTAQLGRVLVDWLSGRLAIDAGGLLSQRLLVGALRGDADRLRHEGVGIALGRVLESDAVQQLAASGGITALLAGVELALAAGVLALGAAPLLHVAALGALVALAAAAARAYLRQRRAWTALRLGLTHRLAEAMVGHTTRLVQGDVGRLADADDHALVGYLVASRAMDRAHWRLVALLPRCWPLAAAACLGPALVLGAPGADALALSIGGMLFAVGAIDRLAVGAARLADAKIAWESVGDLFAAAQARPDVAPPALALAEPSPAAPALAARAVGFRHAGRGVPVFAGAELVVARGDRVLVEGASGAGKSTLAAIVAGLRKPDSGLVLAGGLDRASVGERGWRRRVAYAPQFGDNHVFAAPLAFNLLMARGWPPSPDDLRDAEAVCRELGLGALLDRMPGGLFQHVGETGWQLSHGERSRVFLARALLQRAGLVVLDESLAALDPESLAIAVRCVEARAPAAVVIAHP